MFFDAPADFVFSLAVFSNTVFLKSISRLLTSKSTQRTEFGQRDGGVFERSQCEKIFNLY